MSGPSHSKLFLLVFHGGMTLYLVGHNVLIPLIRNLGTSSPLYYDVELFWALQVLIFYFFIKYDFEKPTKGPIPTLIYITFYSTMLATFQLLQMSKITLSLFAPFISLASLWAFLIVFFLQFKKYFLWESTHFFRRHFFAFIVGLGMIISRNVFLVNPQAKKIFRERVVLPNFIESGCQGSRISFTLPFSGQLPGNSEIFSCGFNFNLIKTDKIKVKNNLSHPIHVRLDHLHNGSFIFKRIQVVKSEESFIFNFEENGIFRLTTPSNPHLGIQVLLKGNLSGYKLGKYLITPKTMVIE